jgi:hypothetical protein
MLSYADAAASVRLATAFSVSGAALRQELLSRRAGAWHLPQAALL